MSNVVDFSAFKSKKEDPVKESIPDDIIEVRYSLDMTTANTAIVDAIATDLTSDLIEMIVDHVCPDNIGAEKITTKEVAFIYESIKSVLYKIGDKPHVFHQIANKNQQVLEATGVSIADAQ